MMQSFHSKLPNNLYGAVLEKQLLETHLVMLNHPFASLPRRTSIKQDHIGNSE